jgi:CheY-like chemotaxis protein
MMRQDAVDNRRILVVDDNVSIHEDFRKILAPPNNEDSLDKARAALFGEAPSLPTQVRYELQFASQGREGLGLVKGTKYRGCPFAVAFVDMRMPPGWDGLETITHIWYADPEIQIVLCTAYSDHPWEDVGRQIGDTDKLLILMKPFNSIQVVQLAHMLTKKWDLARTLKMQMDSLPLSVSQQAGGSQAANLRLQSSVFIGNGGTAQDQSQGDAAAGFRQKEEFLEIMSYELSTRMNNLFAEVGVLLDGPLSPEQRMHVLTLQKYGQDLLSLLKDMHEFMTEGGPTTEPESRH